MENLIVKNNRVILENTNRVYGMLEQGGVCGQKISVTVDVLSQLLGVKPDDIKTLDINAPINEHGTSYKDLIYHEWEYLYGKSHVISKGEIIR